MRVDSMRIRQVPFLGADTPMCAAASLLLPPFFARCSKSALHFLPAWQRLERVAVLDPDRIVVSGVSAGGGLAATTALHARDTSGPRLMGQLLICPMLDHRSDSGSARQMEGVGSWDRTANATAWAAYLNALDGPVPPYASAAMASDLTGLPPTFIDVGSAETFRDECVAYASALWAAGGDAELHVWPGGVHGFDFLAPWAPLSRSARAARVDWLRRLAART